MNRTLHLVDDPEVTARGVALLIRGETEPVVKSVIEPEANAVAIYQQARERQQHSTNNFMRAHHDDAPTIHYSVTGETRRSSKTFADTSCSAFTRTANTSRWSSWAFSICAPST